MKLQSNAKGFSPAPHSCKTQFLCVCLRIRWYFWVSNMQWKSTIHDNIGNKYLYWIVKAHFSGKKKKSHSLLAPMYIIFPFTGFIEDACTSACRHCARVAALSSAVSPPCCIQHCWGCYPRKASNVPSDAFRLGLVKSSSSWNSGRKNCGKLNQEW